MPQLSPDIEAPRNLLPDSFEQQKKIFRNLGYIFTVKANYYRVEFKGRTIVDYKIVPRMRVNKGLATAWLEALAVANVYQQCQNTNRKEQCYEPAKDGFNCSRNRCLSFIKDNLHTPKGKAA